MDGVEPAVVDLVTRKAMSALAFRVPESGIFPYVRPATPAYSLEWSNQGLVMFDGYSPLTFNNE
jgi:uncharacterized protein GlcG (DUF336 family)